MNHKTFRVLLSLVLVCVLLIGWSPIRAQASAIPEVAGVVTKVIPFNPGAGAAAGGAALGSQIFGHVLGGLGLVVTLYQTIDLMNRYSEFTGELETSIYYYPDGSWSYGVDMGFVERVRAFLFHEGILVDKLSTIDPNNAPSAAAMAEAQSALYAALVYTQRYSVISYHLVYSNESQIYVQAKYADGTGVKIGTVSSSATLFSYNAPTDSFSSHKGVAVEANSSYKIIGIHMIGTTAAPEYATTLEDTELGVVAPPDVSIPEAYPEWHVNARPAVNPDTEEEITVLPIPFNPSADPDEDSDTLTQPDIWQGSIADPMPDSGTDTNPDIGSDGSLANTPWEAFKKWISEGWQSIIQAIPTPESIAEAVGNVIKSIFVPDADFISEKWNAIRSRFDFADSISSSGELILDVLNGIDPEPPVIYVDLGDAEGSYYLGGQVAFLDLRWYERYKPTGDAIISAFLWLVFVWRVFIKLPGIIGGLPGDFVMQAVTDLGLADRLPARKKEYENQRQENRRFFKK